MNLWPFGRSDADAPPAPDAASFADVDEYYDEVAKEHGLAPASGGGTGAADEQEWFAKAAPDTAGKRKAEFPWLYDPTRGVRWDFDPIQLRNLAQENTWVEMLIQSITKEVAETPWTITDADRTETHKRLSTHPEEREPLQKDLPDATAERIYDFLHDPNPDDNWQDTVEMWLSDLLEVGSMTAVKAYPQQAYDGDEFVADPASVEPTALQTSAPEVWTKDYHDKTGILDGYWQFDTNSAPGGSNSYSRGQVRGISDPTFFDGAEMVWDDMSPRSNRRYGMPPTLLVHDFLESLDLAIEQEQQYLSRGSIPSGAWVFEEYNRKELKNLKEQMEKNVKGKPHKSLTFAGKGGDVKFEPMSMNFQELEFTERMQWYSKVVAAAFQVPTAVVGLEPEKINYNTFQGERENFESNTLGPYLQQLERVINDQIIQPHWGMDYRFEFQPGMSETTRKMISDRARAEFNAGLIRRNEARNETGREPVDDEFDGFKDEVVEGTDEEDAADAVSELVASVEKADPCINGHALSHETGEVVCEDYGITLDVDDVNLTDACPLCGEQITNMGLPDDTAKAEYEVGDTTIDISPPEYMVAAAEKGQEIRDTHEAELGDCGTGVGNRRARSIINDEVGPDEVDEIAAYLTSHADDVADLDGSYADWSTEEWTSGCGPVQYALWGGTGDGRAREWAQQKSDEVAEARGEEPTYKRGGGSGNAHKAAFAPGDAVTYVWQGERYHGRIGGEPAERIQPPGMDSPVTGADGELVYPVHQWDGDEGAYLALDGEPNTAKPESALAPSTEPLPPLSEAEIINVAVEKADDLRNTDEWYQFDVQPSDVEALQDELAEDIQALYDAVLSDEEILNVIERLAAEDTTKSENTLARRLKELLASLDVAERIGDALRGETADAVSSAIRDAQGDVDEAADVDVVAVRERLQQRDVAFANRFADDLAADIRETVADGWGEGKGSEQIRQDIAEQADIKSGWTGAERIARQELQVATGEARSAVAEDLDKVEVWEDSGDDRVRPAHEAMDGAWKFAGDRWEVDYSVSGGRVRKETVPGDSVDGIGCRCVTLLRDREEVDRADYAGDGGLE